MNGKLKTYLVVADDGYDVRTFGLQKDVTLSKKEINVMVQSSSYTVTKQDFLNIGMENYWWEVDADTGVDTVKYSHTIYTDVIDKVELNTTNAVRAVSFLAGWQYPVHVVSIDGYMNIVAEANEHINTAFKIAGELNVYREANAGILD
jgi:hypothetical protein